MSNSFIPRAFQPQPAPQPETPKIETSTQPDKVGSVLLRASQYLVVALAFLLPIVFVPGVPVALGFSKSIVAFFCSLIIVMLLFLASLRFKSLQTVVPLPLLLFVGVVISAFVSALLSGDVLDALRGSSMGPQTAGFMGILLLVMVVPLVLQRSKLMFLYALGAFGTGVGLVFLYNIVRFIFGPILPVGLFNEVTISPLGGLNDLAVIAAVTIVVSFITLLQLSLKLWMQAIIVSLSVASLFVLMVANFFSLWIVIGFFSLLFLVYVLSRDTLFGSETEVKKDSTVTLIVISLLTSIICGFFVVAGDFAGAKVSQVTGINYIEVRPALGATLDVMKATYQEDILLGAGPNRFGDAWRQHKDRSINETQFWNVDFNAGYGLVPTWFVTFGLLGGILVIAFHLSYLYLAYRTLLKSKLQDSFWFYTATVSFATSIVLWGIMYVYVPGSAVLLITAFFTGLSFVSFQALLPASSLMLPLSGNRRQGLFMMALTVVSIVVSLSVMFSVTKQYAAEATFVKALQNAESPEEFEASVQQAYQMYPEKSFLTALNQLKINQLQSLLTVAEPTEEDQNRFSQLAQQSIALAQEVIAIDSTSPQPYGALADIYNILDSAGLEGARERTYANLDLAQERDQLSPVYDYSRAFIAASNGDFETARGRIADALALKNNYTDALFLLSQIAIEEGNVEAAITATQQVVTFEPNNPTRYYQLGILLAANNQLDDAITSYEIALQLDPEYANARYMLGLAYVASGNSDQALTEFRTLVETNPDNETLRSIISEIESTGGLANLNLGLQSPVEESQTTTNTEDGVVTSSSPDTDLISTVNTEPNDDNDDGAANESSTQAAE